MTEKQEDDEDERLSGNEDIIFIKDEYNGWPWQDKNHAQRLVRGLSRLDDSGLTEEFSVILENNGLTKNSPSFDSTYCDQPGRNSSVVRVLQELREAGRMCDVVLQVRDGDKVDALCCHRAVLAACSSYFNAMLFGRFREGKAKEVTIKDISSKTLRHLVDYFYSGSILFTARNVESFFHSSSLFQLPCLAHACCQYMVQNMNSGNCLGLFQFAKTYFCAELAADAKAFVLEHLPDVVFDGELEDLTVDELEELISDRSHMWGEDTLLEAVVRWVTWDTGKRRGELTSLLQKIDLQKIHKDHLKFVMATQFVIKNSPQCMELLEDAAAKTEALERGLTGNELVLQIGGVSGSERADYKGKRISSVDCFDLVENVWANMTELPQRLLRAYLNITALDNDVYVVATFPEGKQSEVWKYSCMHDVWRRLPNLLEPHSWHFVVQAADKKVFALGDGRTLKSSEKHYEAFDPVANKWSRIAPVPYTVQKVCGASCMEKLYVMGYWEKDQSRFLVHVYKPDGQGWRTFLHPAFHGCKMQYHTATLGCRIYLMPLLATRQDVMCAYNTERNVFEKVALPTNKRLQCGMTATDDSIIVTGGRDMLSCTYATGNAEMFRPEEGRWAIVGKQPGLLRRGHTCVTVNSPGWMLEKLRQARGQEENTGVNQESDIEENRTR